MKETKIRMNIGPAIRLINLDFIFCISSHGRNAGYPAPPVQTRTCGFPASGSSSHLWLPVPDILRQVWFFHVVVPYPLELRIPQLTFLVSAV